MRQTIHCILLLLWSFPSIGQVISEFQWNGSSVTTADIGPDAISVSSSAVVDVNGNNGTTGLNAGLPKMDIDMQLPAAPFEGLQGIDCQIDFQRDESRCDFITCGTTFAFGVDGGDLYVTFEIDDTNGGTTLIQENNIYTVPDDDTFRTYRFYYLPSNGSARVTVNNATVWSNTYSSPASLIWPDQNVTIGMLMDGNGLDKTTIDNLLIAEVYDSALPVELTSFNVSSKEDNITLEWETGSESINDYFTLERSNNGIQYTQIATIQGAGTSNDHLKYKYVDKKINNGIYYYRLKQTDFNGKSALLGIQSIQLESAVEIKIYPNIVERGGSVEFQVPDDLILNSIEIRSIEGHLIRKIILKPDQHKTIDSPKKQGIYVVHFITNDRLISKKLVVK